MFLLLAPSLFTGKRPGLYCPRGRGSQDAPKGPKGEVRGSIVRHDKELTPTSPPPRMHPLKNKTLKLLLFRPALVTPSFIGEPSHYREFQEMKSGQCSDWLFHIEHPDRLCRALSLACVLCISLMEDHELSRTKKIKKWDIQSMQLTGSKAYR